MAADSGAAPHREMRHFVRKGLDFLASGDDFEGSGRKETAGILSGGKPRQHVIIDALESLRAEEPHWAAITPHLGEKCPIVLCFVVVHQLVPPPALATGQIAVVHACAWWHVRDR